MWNRYGHQKVAVYLILKVNFSAKYHKGLPATKSNSGFIKRRRCTMGLALSPGFRLRSTAKNPEVIFNQHGKYAAKLTVKIERYECIDASPIY
ncbi:MAG: hypothetical protein IPM92_09135 [Saprospiraceae bacterium]|nr:hypothetical protein [Saprospiraceae bacterium]